MSIKTRFKILSNIIRTANNQRLDAFKNYVAQIVQIAFSDFKQFGEAKSRGKILKEKYLKYYDHAFKHASDTNLGNNINIVTKSLLEAIQGGFDDGVNGNKNNLDSIRNPLFVQIYNDGLEYSKIKN